MLDELKNDGLTSSDQQLPAAIHVQHGTNSKGRRLHYLFNYSSSPASFTYQYPAATDLLTTRALPSGGQVSVAPWDLVIAEEQHP